MNASMCKTGAMLYALMLLLPACGLIGENTKKEPARRMMSEELQRKNADLREQNKQFAARLAALNKKMTSEREERQRFQDMMATNFELLEQSVSLSLSRSAGKTMKVKPDMMHLPPPAQVAPPPVAPAAPQPRAVPPLPSPLRSEQNRPALPGVDLPAEQRKAPGPLAINEPRRRKEQTPPGGAMLRNATETLADPDLEPPAHPRRLTAHQAAKPMYEKGFQHFTRKDFAQTIHIFQGFLRQFPTDTYSDNVQFWIGESYFRQQRYAEAEEAYRQVLRHYEHRSTLEGFKAPDAIYRIGQTYLRRNDPRRARYYFAAAAQRFPAASAGRKAQHELAALALETVDRSGAQGNGS